MISLLLAVSLAAAAGGPGTLFRDSKLGYDLAGHGTEALDERWVEDFASEPLLMRVERRDESSAVAFYSLDRRATADAGPVFEERARFEVANAPQLDEVKPVDLGSLGPAIQVQVREVVPDEDRVTMLLIGHGPKLLFRESYLHTEPPGPTASWADHPEGFSLRSEQGQPVIDLSSEPKRLELTGADGGLEVELGRIERRYTVSDGAFSLARSGFRDFVPRLAARSTSAPGLVDENLGTGARLRAGHGVRVDLAAPARVRLLRIVPECAGGKGGAAQELKVDLGSGPTLEIRVGEPVRDPRVLGSGLFDMGHGAGKQVLVFFEPELPVEHLDLTLVKGSGPSGSACLAEVSVHGRAQAQP